MQRPCLRFARRRAGTKKLQHVTRTAAAVRCSLSVDNMKVAVEVKELQDSPRPRPSSELDAMGPCD